MITAVMIAVFLTPLGYVAVTGGSSPPLEGASLLLPPPAPPLVARGWLGPSLGTPAGRRGGPRAQQGQFPRRGRHRGCVLCRQRADWRDRGDGRRQAVRGRAR